MNSSDYCDIDEGRMRGVKMAATTKLIRQQNTMVADYDAGHSRIPPVECNTELLPFEVNDAKKTYENAMDWNGEPLYNNPHSIWNRLPL